MVEPGPSQTIQDDLAYLLLFSEALLDLVPYGVGVLDEQLVVRSSNASFARELGFGSRPIVGRRFADEALFLATLPGHEDRSLGEVLRETLDTGRAFSVSDLELESASGERAYWTIRGMPWDTEDSRYRRILLSVERRDRPREEEAAPRASLLEEKDDRIFALVAQKDRLLERLPVGVCLLDPALRVRAVNPWLERALGRTVRVDAPGDRHVFARLPELRDDAFLALLQRCRSEGKPERTAVEWERDGRTVRLETEVQPVTGADDETRELILIFHGEQEMPTARSSQRAVPSVFAVGGEAILAEDNRDRWPAPSNARVLVVEGDAFARMTLSDRLRDERVDDVTLVESNAQAWAGHDPGTHGLLIAGLDGDREDAIAFCRKAAEDAPHVPLLVVTDASESEVREPLGQLRILGLLAGPGPKAELGRVARQLLPEVAAVEVGPDTEEPPAPSADDGDAAEREFEVVVLGAQESDVPVLRVLYRVQNMNIRMVFDPDPDAFGLSLAQNLGIPAVSGQLRTHLDPAPDAVILSRPDLERHLDDFDLRGVARVTRAELELFLVDPVSFVEDASTNDDPVVGAISSAAEEPPAPEAQGEPESPPEPDTPRAEATPRESPAYDPPPAPQVATLFQTPVSDSAPDETRADVADGITAEVGTLLGALDLLLDFDRLAHSLLDMALKLTRAVSGSLMILDEEAQELRIVASSGLSDIVMQQTRQRVGDGVAGRVAQNREPLLLVGRIGDERFHKRGERPEIRSSVCAPISFDGRLVGVLNVNSGPSGDPFGDAELQAVSRLGRQVGGALDRSRQLRQMRGRSFEMSVRAEIESIASADEDLVSRLRRVADRVAQMLRLDTCSIYLFDRKRNELVLRAGSGIGISAMDAVAVPLGTGLVGWVAQNLEPLVLRSGGLADGVPHPVAAGLPIRYHTELIGVMEVEATGPAAVDEDRLRLVATVASVIGQEIGESQAHQASERKVTMLSAISELGVAFTAATEPAGLGRLVTFSASTVLEADVATVRLLQPGADERRPDGFELVAVHGASISGEGDPLGTLEARLHEQVVARREPCQDTELADAAELLRRSNVASALGVPMLSGKQLVGVLVAYRVVDPNDRVGKFRESEAEIGVRLADHAAAAATRFLPDDDEDR